MTTKVEELITSARRHLEESKQQIFLQSQDEQDCINRMVLDVNKSADDFVEADEFFKSVPTEAVQKLLEELDPVLRNEYVNQSFIFIFLDSVLFFLEECKMLSIPVSESRHMFVVFTPCARLQRTFCVHFKQTSANLFLISIWKGT